PEQGCWVPSLGGTLDSHVEGRLAAALGWNRLGMARHRMVPNAGGWDHNDARDGSARPRRGTCTVAGPPPGCGWLRLDPLFIYSRLHGCLARSTYAASGRSAARPHLGHAGSHD